MKKPVSIHTLVLLAALVNVVALSNAAAQQAPDEHQYHEHQHQQDVQPPPARHGHHPQADPATQDQGGIEFDAPDAEAGAHDHPGPQTMPEAAQSPVPPLTDEDRSAVFLSDEGHTVHDNAIVSFWLLDQLEWQDADEGEAASWEATGWIGNDINRLWWRTEGERSDGETEEAELQLLWGHAIGPWWDVVAGVRHDFKPGSSQTWGAIGVQGLALYDFETEATLYVGEGGQTAARLAGEYDILLTNRLILQPTAEVNFYGRNDLERSIGSGLSDIEVGLRLRYEIRREFAPYIGVSWARLYGNTADFVEDEDVALEDTRLVMGIRVWY